MLALTKVSTSYTALNLGNALQYMTNCRDKLQCTHIAERTTLEWVFAEGNKINYVVLHFQNCCGFSMNNGQGWCLATLVEGEASRKDNKRVPGE